ncbi:MAG TPA: DUF4202 domain-containing protein [Ilumatobacter sp.]|nr:DUF4202 domain-containing protein [Ilumatobacter sp.]
MNDLSAAFDAIDAANAGDPTVYDGEPLALAQGRLADGWLLALDRAASPALRLAARAHHLRRWAVPRSSYPEGRAGYLRWRRDQKKRHAAELGELLTRVGIDETTIERAQVIVAKTGLGTDPEVQVFEDAVCLTFLETQLASTAARLEPSHMLAVVVKTLAKMSDDGKALAVTITFDDDMAALIGEALATSAEA